MPHILFNAVACEEIDFSSSKRCPDYFPFNHSRYFSYISRENQKKGKLSIGEINCITKGYKSFFCICSLQRNFEWMQQKPSFPLKLTFTIQTFYFNNIFVSKFPLSIFMKNMRRAEFPQVRLSYV